MIAIRKRQLHSSGGKDGVFFCPSTPNPGLSGIPLRALSLERVRDGLRFDGFGAKSRRIRVELGPTPHRSARVFSSPSRVPLRESEANALFRFQN